MGNALHGADPSAKPFASDEVIDAIAEIEMLRRETQREAGLAVSCGSALRKLHELLDHEKEALQSHGPDAGRRENVDAVTIEIERLKGRAPATGQGPAGRTAFPERKQASWQYARRNPARKKTG